MSDWLPEGASISSYHNTTCPTCGSDKREVRKHRHTEVGGDGREWLTRWSSHHTSDDMSRGVDGLHAGFIKHTEECPNPWHASPTPPVPPEEDDGYIDLPMTCEGLICGEDPDRCPDCTTQAALSTPPREVAPEDLPPLDSVMAHLKDIADNPDSWAFTPEEYATLTRALSHPSPERVREIAERHAHVDMDLAEATDAIEAAINESWEGSK